MNYDNNNEILIKLNSTNTTKQVNNNYNSILNNDSSKIIKLSSNIYDEKEIKNMENDESKIKNESESSSESEFETDNYINKEYDNIAYDAIDIENTYDIIDEKEINNTSYKI